jgi:hypothetical protein
MVAVPATTAMEVVKKDKKADEDYAIKPQADTPAIDTSEWPLLLKNFDKRACRPDLEPRYISAFRLLMFSLQCTSGRATSRPSPMAARR